MRFLIAALLISLSACGPKVATQTPPRAKTVEIERVLKHSANLSNYSQTTESLFALLWPADFNAQGKKILSRSLKLAKELQNTRKTYTSESTRLKKVSREHQCECVLTGICETEVSPAQQEQSLKHCTQAETEQLKNDERLSTLVQLQEDLKNSVLEMGGFWLDAPLQPIYSFSTGTIDFNGAEFFNSNGKRFALSSDDAFWKLDSVKIDGALQAQGELKVKYDGRTYRGELGFQLPERGN